MTFECIGVTGYAGDRTSEAMIVCHDFTCAMSRYFNWPFDLVGVPTEPRNLNRDTAIAESKMTLDLVVSNLNRIFEAEHRPILITPRCASAVASITVVVSKFPELVILWFDAHGDVHTPKTSESGYFGGMPITAVLGLWDSGYGSGLKVANLVHIGGRDLDPAYTEFMEAQDVFRVSRSDIGGEMNELRAVIKDKPVYIHLDTDVHDPTEVSAEYAVEYGLSRDDVKNVVDLVAKETELVGVEITELSPRNSAEKLQSYSAIFESFSGLKTHS